MTPLDASKLLDLAPDATPEQAEARFLELRGKLEDKIAKAPTPGLKEKYRATLTDITTAFETLTLAADSSSLPVLNRERAEDRGPKTQGHAPGAADSNSRVKTRAGGKEFLLVAAIAVAVLAAGGWWLVNSRNESAELERTEAAAKADAERQVMLEKQKAETDRLAKETAEKAERDRLESLNASLRARFAEAKIKWEAIEREGPSAERRLSELRSDARSARDLSPGEQAALAAQVAAQQGYSEWLLAWLSAHPAKALIARTDALLGARSFDDASTALTTLASILENAPAELASTKSDRLNITGALRVATEPTGVPFSVIDNYGRNLSGQTPAELKDIPYGTATVTFRRPGWPIRTEAVVVSRTNTPTARTEFIGGALELTSAPSDLTFELRGMGRAEQGRTPAHFNDFPPGEYTLLVKRSGWRDESRSATIAPNKSATVAVEFPKGGSFKATTTPAGAEVWMNGQLLGTTPLSIAEFAPGNIELEFKLADYVTTKKSGLLASSGQIELSATLERDLKAAFGEFWRQAAGVWRKGGMLANIPGDAQLWRISEGSTTVTFRVKSWPFSQDNVYEMTGVDPSTGAISLSYKGKPGAGTMAIVNGELVWDIGTPNKPKLLPYGRTNDSDW